MKARANEVRSVEMVTGGGLSVRRTKRVTVGEPVWGGGLSARQVENVMWSEGVGEGLSVAGRGVGRVVMQRDLLTLTGLLPRVPFHPVCRQQIGHVPARRSHTTTVLNS